MAFFFFFFSFFSPSLFCVSIGNPGAPSLLQEGFFIPDTSFSNIQLAYLGDSLFQKRFQPSRLSRVFGLHKATLQGTSQMGILIWNVFEKVNFQFELGSGQFQWKWVQGAQSFVSGNLDNGLIWSANMKAVFFEVNNTLVVADGRVGGWDWMTGNSNFQGIPSIGSSESNMRYWQLAAAIVQKINFFSPYFGIVANETKLKIDQIPTGTGWLRSRHKLGGFIGCTLSTGSYFFLNFESRAWFEQGFSVSGQFRF